MIRSAILLTLLLLLTGCSALGLGHNKGYCEENGADLQDAGVCWSPWNIIHNREDANKMAYGGGNKCK